MFLSGCYVDVEQPHIHIDPRDKFTGVFDVDEYSETLGVYHHYTIDIVKDAHFPASVFLMNFYGEGIEVMADVEGVYLTIPHQEVAGFHVEGEGFINGGKLELFYSVHDHYAHNDFVDYCSTVAWRVH